jgi:hypothetical protein
VREELEKQGKPIDDATRSVAAYADGWDNLKKGVGDVAIETLSYFTRAGEGWGHMINLIRGVSDEQMALRAQTQKDADEAEKRLAKSLEANSPEKLQAAAEKLAAAMRKNQEAQLDGQAKINALNEDYNRLVDEALALGRGTVAFKEKEIELATLAGTINAEQAKFDKASHDQAKKDGEEEQALFDEQQKSLEKQAKAKADLLKAAEAQREAEALVTTEFAKQLDIIRKMAGGNKTGFIAGPNGGQVAGTTVSELDNKLRNAQNAFEYLKKNPNAPGYSNDYIAARDLITQTQADLQAAKNATSTIGSGYSGGIPLDQLPSNQITSYGTGIDMRTRINIDPRGVGAGMSSYAGGTSGFNSPDITKIGDDIGSILDTLTNTFGDK